MVKLIGECVCLRVGNLSSCGLFSSTEGDQDTGYGRGFGVRAVVTLKSNVKLSGNSTDGWTIQ